MKISTDKVMIELKNDEISIEHGIVTYAQRCDLDEKEFQDIKIEICEKGAGKYIVIKTDRWAFDCIDEFIDLLKDFKKRLL